MGALVHPGAMQGCGRHRGKRCRAERERYSVHEGVHEGVRAQAGLSGTEGCSFQPPPLANLLKNTTQQSPANVIINRGRRWLLYNNVSTGSRILPPRA